MDGGDKTRRPTLPRDSAIQDQGTRTRSLTIGLGCRPSDYGPGLGDRKWTPSRRPRLDSDIKTGFGDRLSPCIVISVSRGQAVAAGRAKMSQSKGSSAGGAAALARSRGSTRTCSARRPESESDVCRTATASESACRTESRCRRADSAAAFRSSGSSSACSASSTESVVTAHSRHLAIRAKLGPKCSNSCVCVCACACVRVCVCVRARARVRVHGGADLRC